MSPSTELPTLVRTISGAILGEDFALEANEGDCSTDELCEPMLLLLSRRHGAGPPLGDEYKLNDDSIVDRAGVTRDRANIVDALLPARCIGERCALGDRIDNDSISDSKQSEGAP